MEEDDGIIKCIQCGFGIPENKSDLCILCIDVERWIIYNSVNKYKKHINIVCIETTGVLRQYFKTIYPIEQTRVSIKREREEYDKYNLALKEQSEMREKWIEGGGKEKYERLCEIKQELSDKTREVYHSYRLTLSYPCKYISYNEHEYEMAIPTVLEYAQRNTTSQECRQLVFLYKKLKKMKKSYDDWLERKELTDFIDSHYRNLTECVKFKERIVEFETNKLIELEEQLKEKVDTSLDNVVSCIVKLVLISSHQKSFLSNYNYTKCISTDLPNFLAFRIVSCVPLPLSLGKAKT